MEIIKDYSKVVSEIRKSLKVYLLENKLQSLILGVSGGVDSALVAALAKPICDELNIPIIGRSLTIESNKLEEISRAKNIGEEFCHDFKEFDLTSDYINIKHLDQLDQNEDNDINSVFNKIKFGNMKARTRMIYLYNLAYKNRGMVLSTDNYTEFLLGFSTIMGDWGDYGMVQYLWKTEVYNMCEWLCENELVDSSMSALWSCVVCQATDGLGISNTDLDQLLPGWDGSSRDGYEVVDKKLIGHLEGSMSKSGDPIIERHNKSHFKRNWPITIKRETLVSSQ